MSAGTGRVSHEGPLVGPRCLRDGLRLLRTRRELWLWAALPILLNVVAFAVAAVVFFAQLDALTSWAQAWLAVGDPGAWYGWIWVAPLRAAAWLARGALIMLFALVTYFSFTLVGGVIASPFLDVLSQRVEQLRGADAAPSQGSLLASALRSAVEEGKRALFFVSAQLVILSLGLVPGLQVVVPAAAVAFAAWFLPLDFTGYALDRRGVRFRERRSWLWGNRTAMLGFGITALPTFLVPGLNFLCLPWLVTAGTLLALEVGPPGDG